MKKIVFLFCLFLSLSMSFARAQSSDSLRIRFAQLDTMFTHHAENNPQLVLNYAMEQERIANQLGIDSLKLTSWFNKSRALSLMAIFDKGLEFYYKGLRLAESIHDEESQADNLLEIARNYQSLEDYSKSNSYFEKSKFKYIHIKSYRDTILINYEIAFNRAVQGDFNFGFKTLEENLKAAYTRNDTNAIVLGLDNIANILVEHNEVAKALTYELQILNYPSGFESNLYKTGLFEHISEIYFKVKNYKESERYLDSCFKYAQLYQSKDWMMEYYRMKTMLLETKGDYKSAYQTHQYYVELKDSVYKSNYDVKMSAMSSLYELENKQSKIKMLEQDNELKQSQRNLVLLVGLGLVIAVAFGFWYRNQQQQKMMRINFSRDLIDSQEMERQRISRELHDSVGQNILFIKNQLVRKNKDDEFAPILETVSTAIEEVRSISKDLYPSQLEKYGLYASVETMINKAMESDDVFISADLNHVEQLLSKDSLIHVYRIIQESLNNALKYAKASSIRITAIQVKNMIELIIQDNGQGFDTKILELKAQRHVGILSIEERLKMMKGSLHIESNIGKGTKLTCIIPFV